MSDKSVESVRSDKSAAARIDILRHMGVNTRKTKVKPIKVTSTVNSETPSMSD